MWVRLSREPTRRQVYAKGRAFQYNSRKRTVEKVMKVDTGYVIPTLLFFSFFFLFYLGRTSSSEKVNDNVLLKLYLDNVLSIYIQ